MMGQGVCPTNDPQRTKREGKLPNGRNENDNESWNGRRRNGDEGRNEGRKRKRNR